MVYTCKYIINKKIGSDYEVIDILCDYIKINTSLEKFTQTGQISIPISRGIGYDKNTRSLYLIKLDSKGNNVYQRTEDKTLNISDYLQIQLYYDEVFSSIVFRFYISKISLTEDFIIIDLEDDMFQLKNFRLKYSSASGTIKDVCDKLDEKVIENKINLIKPLSTIFTLQSYKEKYDFPLYKITTLEPLSAVELLLKIKELYDNSFYFYFKNNILHLGIKYFNFLENYNTLAVGIGYSRHSVYIPNILENEWDIRDAVDENNNKNGLLNINSNFTFETRDKRDIVVNVISRSGDGITTVYATAASDETGKMETWREGYNFGLVLKDKKFNDKNKNIIEYKLPNLTVDSCKLIAENKFNQIVGGTFNKIYGNISTFGNRFVRFSDIIDLKIKLPADIQTDSYYVDGVNYYLNANGLRQEIILGDFLTSTNSSGNSTLLKSNQIE